MSRIVSLVASCLVLWSPLGCGADLAPPDPVDPDAVSRVDLQAAFGVPDPLPVGVTVAPDTGRVFVLDGIEGLFEIAADGSATRVLALRDFPTPDQAPESGYTDIAALGDDRFALTAINDGFLLDVAAHELRQHFCYVPPDTPFGAFQMTFSVAFDPATSRILAQPQSFDDEGALTASQIGEWDSVTGDELAWHDLADPQFRAGGLAVERTGSLLLGRDEILYRFEIATGALTAIADLTDAGVTSAAGVAIVASPDGQRLLIADWATDELISIPMTAID